MKLTKTNHEQEIADIKNILHDYESKANRADAEEAFLLKQLKENFDVDTVEDGKELLDQLISETDEITEEKNELYKNLISDMKKDGLI